MAKTFRRAAFTLIELLIVVAIIAILAAIAVPNFLEAQTRSKVSRAKADMRSLAVAAEAYVVDHNDYPPNSGQPTNNALGNQATFMFPLSTPVSYIGSARLTDVFGNSCFNFLAGNSYYFYYRSSMNDLLSSIVVALAYPPGPDRDIILSYRYVIGSAGPDRVYVIQEQAADPCNPGATYPGPWVDWVQISRSGDDIYDPTNGTVSGGDIWYSTKGFRTGGN
jgi:prepilin-type N-terminal cleavage/methylation domain-containing protein